MKILPHIQGSIEWLAARKGLPTASEFAPFMIEKPKCRLLKTEMQEILTASGITFDKKAANDDLIALLPDVTPYLSLTATAAKSRAEYICAKLTETMDNDAFEQEAEDKLRKYLDADPWIRRGKWLEGFAREDLAERIGREIVETGLILHDSGAFGASPDGLIVGADGDVWVAGAEIKCHNRKRHLADLLAGDLPDDHRFQVHGSMAVTGLDTWHYFAWHPKLPPIHVVVEWDAFTEDLLAGLLDLAAEMEATRATLAELWDRDSERKGVA